jgi:peptidoglycan/xylan/chitin deacetylase (PgdA/CDA1 family)
MHFASQDENGCGGVAGQMMQRLKSRGGIASGLARWGVLPYHMLRRDRRPGVIVLAYHRIGGGTRAETDLAAELFERQIRYVKRRFRVAPLDDVPRLRASDLRTDTAVITFDDGFAETYTVAYPIVRRYEVPITVYVPAAYIEQRRPFDFGVFATMHPRPLPMTWDQAREMSASGLVTIGAHTHTHADFSMTAASEARREMDACDDLIERRLGARPRHFAYPWGRWSAETHALTAARYETVALTMPGKNAYQTLDRSRLYRLPVIQSDGFWRFLARVRSQPARDGAWAAPGSAEVEQST